MLSAFGVDHGDVSKFLTTVAAGGIGAAEGSKRAKTKHKTDAAISGGLRTGAGEILGQGAGVTAGLATRKPGLIFPGALVGSVGGAGLGNRSARKKAEREGWTKKKG